MRLLLLCNRLPENCVLDVFRWPVLSVAETTTTDAGMSGPDSNNSVRISFSDTSEVTTVGDVIALPESKAAEKSVILNVTKRKNIIRGGSHVVLL